MKWLNLASKAVQIIAAAFVLYSLARTIEIPLQGTHAWRQSDFLFMAYSYCKEDTQFLRPKVAPRQGTSGVAIGELPVFSYMLSLKCKATGQWDEAFPKVMTYLFLLLNLFLWWVFLKKEAGGVFPSLGVFSSIMFFAPITLLHMTIPIPDVFTLALVPIIGLLKDKNRPHEIALSLFLFVVVFLIRPYFIPFVLVVYNRRALQVAAVALCTLAYLVWFKYWVYTSELHQHMGTELRDPLMVLKQLPMAGPRLIWDLFRDHWNFLGILFIIPVWRSDRRWLLTGLGGALLVLLLRGEHFIAHGYYLLVPAVAGFYFMAKGYLKASPKWREPVLALMALLGIAAVQHHWNPEKNALGIRLRSEVAALSQPTDQIAIYGAVSPAYHYEALRVGWRLPTESFKGFNECPPNVKLAVVIDPSGDDFRIGLCEPKAAM